MRQAVPVGALVLSLLGVVLVTAPAQAQAGPTIELRVLVVSTGSAEDDPGLDLIDDVLDELAVRYDVLDASTTELSADLLADGQRGFYNGIIITSAGLDPDLDGSSFTDAEWEVLQQYERDFGVREAIIGGAPVVSSPLLDFGLTEAGAGSDFSGQWVGPAGTEVFSYVNTSTELAISDFALTASARNDGVGPSVDPVLVNAADPTQILISILRYDDGREVLLSTISNAWFLLHSQVLAYGLVEFATRGLHLGAQRVYLNAHVDDMLLPSVIWDSETNANSEHETYRNDPADIDTMLSAQQVLVEEHPTLEQFKVEFAFNAFGSGLVPPRGFPLVSDTTVAQDRPGRAYGTSGVLRMSAESPRRMLVRFDLTTAEATPAVFFGLSLVGAGAGRAAAGQVCRVSQAWQESESTWFAAADDEPWAGGSGPSVDESSCMSFMVGDGTDAIDVTALVADWTAGEPNYGLALSFEGSYSTAAREAGVGVALTRGIRQSQPDPLTQRLLEAGDSIGMISHTFSHLDMDVSNGTTELQAYRELVGNLWWWDTLGLPGVEENRKTAITGEHSGLADNNGTVLDLSDDIDFPEGANPALLDAAEASGVRYLAADASRPGQQEQTFIEGRDIVILPRYPTGVFFNVSTPDQLTDEYNWVFNGSYLERGEDPCEVAAAICDPAEYPEIVDAETAIGLRQMLSYRAWPHFFHVPNLVDYDGQGSSVLFDWLDGVMDRYEAVFSLPVLSPPFQEIGELAEARILARSAEVEAVLDVESGVVTVTADRDVTVEITGLANGAPYGPRLIAQIDLQAGIPRSAAVTPGPSRSLEAVDATTIGVPFPGAGRARLRSGGGYEALLRFDAVGLDSAPNFALLRLPAVRVSGAATQVDAQVCLVTESWLADEVTWLNSATGLSWGTGGGAAADPEVCVNASLSEGTTTAIDVAALTAAWASGAENNGVVVRIDGSAIGSFDSFDAAGGGPTLVVG